MGRICPLIMYWYLAIAECAFPEKNKCGFKMFESLNGVIYQICENIVDEVGLATMLKMNIEARLFWQQQKQQEEEK